MKRFPALLCACFCFLLLTGCDFLSGIELAEPESEPEAETEEIEEEPEGPKALTLMFAHAIDEGRTGLLEAARQAAQEKGYTLSTVVSLGDPKLQSRFLQLARDAGEQAILLELADPAAAAAVLDDAGEMAVVFVDVLPDSGLSKRAIYVGNPEGDGDPYLRLTGRTAMLAADNLIRGEAANTETELKLSGHKITVPADGVLPIS